MHYTFEVDDKVEIGFILRSRGDSHVAEILKQIEIALEAGETVTVTNKNDEYNGWSNRETWCLVLQLDNDQGLYEGVLDAVRNADKAQHLTGDDVRLFDIESAGRAAKEYADGLLTVDGYTDVYGGDHLPSSLARIAEDIGSLYRVDWDEVGAHYLEVLSEQVENEK